MVKLTPEILEYNGFTSLYEDKTAYSFKLIENDFVEQILIDFSRPRSSWIYNEKTKSSYDGKIEYVEDLNTLFRLIEIDKEIIVR